MQGIGWEAGRWSQSKFALPHVVFPVYVSISFIVSCAASELSEKKTCCFFKKGNLYVVLILHMIAVWLMQTAIVAMVDEFSGSPRSKKTLKINVA